MTKLSTHRYLNTDSTEYSVIFTANATAAIKLVGESIDWKRNTGHFWHLRECHTSVLGIRNYIQDADNIKPTPRVRGVTADEIEQYLSTNMQNPPSAHPTSPHPSRNTSPNFNLFAYPAQCNHSGTRFPLSYTSHLHSLAASQNPSPNPWKILLDASSYATTTPPNLSLHTPDFLVLSFYKLFGFPTGLGALIVRNSSIPCLNGRKYFGGGTVGAVCWDEMWEKSREGVAERFEDGTVGFQQVLALERGFEFLESKLGGWSRVRSHTMFLTEYLYGGMKEMRFLEGGSICKVYSGPAGERRKRVGDDGVEWEYGQGPIVNFNILRPGGGVVKPSEIMRLAAVNGIHLRAGCFCNPGACQAALGLSSGQVKEYADVHGHVCWDDKDVIDNQPLASLRVSFGASSTFGDALAFLQFLRTFFVDPFDSLPSLPPLPMRFTSTTTTKPTITSLTIYPIKSCGGYSVTEWPIGPTGLVLDRR
ncbi:hypothetical protein HK097_009530, partial [Rhizophlyctis rosea]